MQQHHWQKHSTTCCFRAVFGCQAAANAQQHGLLDVPRANGSACCPHGNVAHAKAEAQLAWNTMQNAGACSALPKNIRRTPRACMAMQLLQHLPVLQNHDQPLEARPPQELLHKDLHCGGVDRQRQQDQAGQDGPVVVVDPPGADAAAIHLQGWSNLGTGASLTPDSALGQQQSSGKPCTSCAVQLQTSEQSHSLPERSGAATWG